MFFILHSTGKTKAERLAHDEIVKLWQHSFGAKKEDFKDKTTITGGIHRMMKQYRDHLKAGVRHRVKNIPKFSEEFQQMLPFFESVFWPVIAAPPKIFKCCPFPAWERKGLSFALDLGIAVMRIPSFDEFLLGKQSSSSWISDNIMSPPSPLLADDDNQVDSNCEVDTRSLTFDTLTWDSSKNDKHAATRLKDQSTQTVTHCPPSSQTWPGNFFKIGDLVGDKMEDR